MKVLSCVCVLLLAFIGACSMYFILHFYVRCFSLPIILGATCNVQTFLAGKFSRCQSLNSVYDLYWNIEGNDLIVGVHLQAGSLFQNGWVGLGTSVNGGMRGADIAVTR